jgi:formylglycine-generating enzyme required for sulfatase activity
MVIVKVEAGEFLMGSTDSDIDEVMAECPLCKKDFFADEQPQHLVFLDAFWIDRTEVTNAQYKLCADEGVCRVVPEHMGNYDPVGKANYPIVQVTWNDAIVYCKWAGARLPTEAEWEKAARGTDGRRYPWGTEAINCNMANYAAPDGHCVGETMSVESYSDLGASPFEAWNMAGNVWEWVNDWYDPNYYALSPAENPPGPAAGKERVVRGGSWNDGHRNMRSADRGLRDPFDRYGLIGFRCAVSP